MSKQVIDDSIWNTRLEAANLYYKEWEKRFKCDILDRYYEGEQWKSQQFLGYDPYVINKIYETIQIKISEFCPTFPVFNVSAAEGHEDDLNAAIQSVQLKQDVLNTIISRPDGHFPEEIEQAYKDSFFRFGIIEVGYAADWIINPNAPKPLLGKDTDAQGSSKQRRRVADEPKELPQSERIYYKHIPAKTFRVGGMDHKYLSRCGWCGYYEFIDKDELLSLKILNKDKIESIPGVASEVDHESTLIDSSRYKRNSLKIWHIWDMKARVELLVLDKPAITVFERKFKRLPLFDYRPDRRLMTNGFYPIPPAFHWLSCQNEINETREMLRAHRRRFVRKFQVREGMVDDTEIEKFETGPDGALIKVKAENAITPVQNADLGSALQEAIATSADDLNKISGTSDPSRGVSDRGTATEAQIVNTKGSLRESKEQSRTTLWINLIGRETLLLVRDKFTSRVLVKMTRSEGEGFMGTVQTITPTYRYITSEDLKDGYDFNVTVEYTSLSASAQLTEKQKMLEFLSTLTQFPMLAFSPYLIRETAYRIGYRNEKAIAEFQQMALLMELGRMNQLKQAAAPPQPQPGNAGQQITQQMTPPNAEQMRNQMANQLPQAAAPGGLQ